MKPKWKINVFGDHDLMLNDIRIGRVTEVPLMSVAFYGLDGKGHCGTFGFDTLVSAKRWVMSEFKRAVKVKK